MAGSSRSSTPSGRSSTLRGIGRFLALAANPARLKNGLLGSLLTGVVAGGVWSVLTFVVQPGTRHVHVQTPFGAHEVTVALSRWPWAIAIACVFGTALVLIAGIRLQLKRDAERTAAPGHEG